VYTLWSSVADLTPVSTKHWYLVVIHVLGVYFAQKLAHAADTYI